VRRSRGGGSLNRSGLIGGPRREVLLGFFGDSVAVRGPTAASFGNMESSKWITCVKRTPLRPGVNEEEIMCKKGTFG
jgi:hypothetical protein